MAETALTLLCFAQAGGNAQGFRRWAAWLPETLRLLPLDRPGHGARRGEAPEQDWDRLLPRLLAAVPPRLGPYALFGHSLGALVALEMAHALRAAGHGEPAWLAVSGCAAPGARRPGPGWRDAPDRAVVARLRELGGTPEALFDAPELLQAVLPGLRCELHLGDTHRAPPRAPLGCPVLALRGREDALPAADALQAWAPESRGALRCVALEGGHFLTEAAERAIARELLALSPQALRHLAYG